MIMKIIIIQIIFLTGSSNHFQILNFPKFSKNFKSFRFFLTKKHSEIIWIKNGIVKLLLIGQNSFENYDSEFRYWLLDPMGKITVLKIKMIFSPSLLKLKKICQCYPTSYMFMECIKICFAYFNIETKLGCMYLKFLLCMIFNTMG